jgi:hypothetical protein
MYAPMNVYPDVNRPAASAVHASTPAARESVSPRWTGGLLAVGALITAVGTFLPFEKIIAFHHAVPVATVTFTGVGAKSATGLPISGLEAGNGGKLILGLAVLCAGALVLAIATLGAPAGDAKTLNASTESGWAAHALARTGCHLVTAGAGVALVAALLAVGLRRVVADRCGYETCADVADC